MKKKKKKKKGKATEQGVVPRYLVKILENQTKMPYTKCRDILYHAIGLCMNMIVRQPSQRDVAQLVKPRLPRGASYSATYDGLHWTATLTIGGACYHASASGLFAALEKADSLYRKDIQ